MSDLGPKPLPGWVVIGCGLLLVGAFVATLVAYLSAALYCDENCHRDGLATTQFLVAGFGLVPATLMLVAAGLGSRRWTVAMLGVAIATYLTWGALNDALIHGWSNVP